MVMVTDKFDTTDIKLLRRITTDPTDVIRPTFITVDNLNWFIGNIPSPLHSGKYVVYFETDLEDGGFIITIPTLKGCVTEAENIEDAYKSIKDALDGWIAVAQQKGLEIPKPDFV